TNIPVRGVRVRIWGVPADPRHNKERICFDRETGNFIHGCPTDAPERPFFTLPTACTGPLESRLKVESLQEPGVFKEASAEFLGEGGSPEGLNNCAAPAFGPTIASQPETTASDSPTGLHFHLHLHQNEAPQGTATAQLKDTVLTLPRGLAVNPSAADGLGACSAAQIGLKTAPGQSPIQFTPAAPACPPSSKMGTVEVESPLLDHPLPGTVYLAKQGENPFGSLIALYVTVDDPLTGI